MKQVARVFLVAVLGAAASLSCRRGREKEAETAPQPAAAVVEETDVASRAPASRRAAAPVLWLGLDGLDWELLDRLSAEGKMPNWKRLVEEGWSARLASFYPLLSPILWTSAATGVGPDVHRVLDFQEVDPKTGRKVPISGISRAVPAAWNLASASGKKVGVVGWWATHPAEEVNGFFLTDRVSPLLFGDLPLAGVAFPAGLEGRVRQVIEREARIAPEDLEGFLGVPRQEIARLLAGAERPAGSGRTRHPVAGLSSVLAATRVSHRIARDLYDRERPDLLALYLEGTDEVGHLFAAYSPPKLDCVSDREFARYGRAVETYYGAVDLMLGQWMRRAAEDGATLLVHSDHGFKWGPDRPCGFASASWATAAFWHRPEGVIAAWGGRTVPAKERTAAKLLDVAPTVLALLGLPADRRMPGSVLPAFGNLATPLREDFFSRLAVHRVAAEPPTERGTSEYVNKLIALGYLSPSETRPLAPSGGDRPGMTEGAWNNLGVYYRDTMKRLPAAREAFEKSLALSPGYYSALFNMAVLERARGDTKAAETWFLESVAAAGGDPAPAVLSWAREYEKEGKVAAATSLLANASRAHPANEDIARSLAMELFRARDCRRGLAVLSPFEAATTSPSTFNVLALLQTCLENRAEVVRLLSRSLELKRDQPDVARSLKAAEGP